MERSDADPLADHLIRSYLGTAAHSRQFADEWGQPPTRAAQAQILRSIAQVLILEDERLILDPEYVESGRLAYEVAETKALYLVRSSAAVTIEQGIVQRLFSIAGFHESPVTLVVYRFHKEGLDLGHAPTRRQRGRRRLVAAEPPEHLGTWPFASSTLPPFNQGSSEAWRELGELGHDSEEVGGNA